MVLTLSMAFQGCGVHSIRVICGLKSIPSRNHKIWKTLHQFRLRSVQPGRLIVKLSSPTYSVGLE
jgi:hypothetical protein